MKELLIKTGLVMIGGTIQGIGMGLFLFPQSIPSGGAGGIAILLNYFFPISLGPALFIVNFLLLLIGVNHLGKGFALWTVLGMTMASLTIHHIENTFLIYDRILLYDLVFGSVFLGIGIGVLMHQGVSNGGIGVIAYMIAHEKNILPGKPLFFINCFVFFLTAAIISWKIILLAFVSQWIATMIVDFICHTRLYETYTLDWKRKV